MPDGFVVAIDLVAIAVLTYGVYFRRHRRRDMLLAYVALNIGVMAIAIALSSNTVTAGLGLGLFGVLVGSSRVDLQACKLEYSIVSPK